MTSSSARVEKRRERGSNYSVVAGILELEDMHEPQTAQTLVSGVNAIGPAPTDMREIEILDTGAPVESFYSDEFEVALITEELLVVEYAFPKRARRGKEVDFVLEKFKALAEQWEQETEHLSSVVDIATHPSYQQIIGMGEVVLPYILRRLSEQPNHWFWALRAISGEDPTKPGHKGKVTEMREDWMSWGRERGYI